MKELLQTTEGVIILSITGLFALSLLIQLFYYLFFYLRLAWGKVKINENNNEPVSVIICAREEAENLEKFLPLVLEQDYPNFEVIVVNDCSEDHTENVLKNFQLKYSNLRYTTIKKDEKFTHGKKLAQTIGIKSAINEKLIFTDADCYPTSNQWIKNISGSFQSKTEILLAYGGYERAPGFLNKLIRFDTFFIALQYLTFARAGIPYMGVGRNLSYLKGLFFRNKGFASHARLLSGDDDLFVNETATSKNTSILINTESITRSIPKKKFIYWLRQKKRHRTTFPRYKFSHKFLLALEPISRLLFYASFTTLLVFQFFPLWIIIAFSIRLIIQLLTLYFATKRLQEKDLLLYSPIFDLLFIFIGFMIKFSGKFRNPYVWR
ncbi:MAG: glycosyltransferase [Bacteroidia bacterium]|nr:glycosyltransferase [Bacteroidia bacterium]